MSSLAPQQNTRLSKVTSFVWQRRANERATSAASVSSPPHPGPLVKRVYRRAVTMTHDVSTATSGGGGGGADGGTRKGNEVNDQL